MKILWASPLPPTRSGVSDYAVELLGELSRIADVRVVAPPGHPGLDATGMDLGCPMVTTATVPSPDEIQLVHLGNNPFHDWLVERARMPRTAVVLHDAVLHHLLVESTLARGDFDGYSAGIRRAHPEAEAMVRARGFGVTGPRDPFLFPARRAFLADAAMVIVHSQWAAEQVARDLPEVPVARIGLAVADPGPVDRIEVRQRLGIEPDTVLLVHIGFLTPEKGLVEVLGALASARAMGAPARLLVVGEGAELDRVASAADRLGIAQATSFSGWVPADLFAPLPSAADVGVVLRDPSAGETSAAVIRFLACGSPVAVSAVRQFLEWPEEAAPRVTPGAAASADLTRVILQAAEGAEWERRRSAARSAYEAEHLPAAAARRLVGALQNAAIVE